MENNFGDDAGKKDEQQQMPSKTMTVVGDASGGCLCWSKTTPSWDVTGYDEGIEKISLEYTDKTGKRVAKRSFSAENALQKGEVKATKMNNNGVVKIEEKNYRDVEEATKVVQDIMNAIFFVYDSRYSKNGVYSYKDLQQFCQYNHVAMICRDKNGLTFKEGEKNKTVGNIRVITSDELANISFSEAKIVGDFYKGNMETEELEIDPRKLQNLTSLRSVKIVLQEAPSAQ